MLPDSDRTVYINRSKNFLENNKGVGKGIKGMAKNKKTKGNDQEKNKNGRLSHRKEGENRGNPCVWRKAESPKSGGRSHRTGVGGLMICC